jgi:hypothetical protein
VVCLALVALNFLLPREDEPPAPSPASLAASAPAREPHARGLSVGTANVGAHRDALGGTVEVARADRSPRAAPEAATSSGGVRPQRAGLEYGTAPVDAKPPRQGRKLAAENLDKISASSNDKSQGIVPKSHTEPERQNVKSLGYVETGDGRKKAVIGEGEWIQLVEEGQLLADNSRVVKVTPTSVEIVREPETQVASQETALRSAGVAQTVVASATPDPLGRAPVDDALPDVADARPEAKVEDSPGQLAGVQPAGPPTQDRLPHETGGEASLAANWRLPTPGPTPRLVDPEKSASERLPVDAALPPSAFQPAAESTKSLGFVQKADGTTLTVVANGDSVRLEEQPQIASVTPTSFPPDLPGGGAKEIPNGGFRVTSPLGSRRGLGGGIGPSATLRALGYVERADGRLQVVLDAGDSVQLVEEGQVLADGSRIVGITPTSVEVAYEPTDPSTVLPAREQDLLAVATAGSGGSVRLRAPLRQGKFAAPDPVPRARGMPATGARAAFTRAPPHHAPRDWIEGLSREHPAMEAAQAPTTARSLPASTTAEAFPAPQGRAEGEVRPENVSSTAGHDFDAGPQGYSIRPLGFVEWPGGRLQAIVSRGDGVELLEEGQALVDGSRVVAVSPTAVELSRAARPSHARPATSQDGAEDPEQLVVSAGGARVTKAWAGQVLPSEAYPPGPGVSEASGLSSDWDFDTNTQRVRGNGLHLNRPVRDNRDEPRK